jgi:virginiamycin B lyase
MRPAGRILSSVMLATLFGSIASAGTITGTVKGPDGAPFKGAFVEAQNTSNKITVSVLSAKDGRYRIENLPSASYELRIRAIGYKADPRAGVSLTDKQTTSLDWALQKGMVRWSDLNLYQGKTLFPNVKGKDVLEQNCFVCHGFQTRMAATVRDEAGWRDRVNYMREAMKFGLASRFTDDKADAVVSFLNYTFGEDSAVPRSPAELPGYQDLVRPVNDKALNIVYVEYDVSGSKGLPWSAAPDKDGDFWMPYYGRGNEVARLNPKTGEVKRFPLPFAETAGVHSAFPAPDGTVWFTEFALNRIGHLDPKTGEITEYQDEGAVPNERPGKHTIRLDQDGNIWTSGSPLTRFDVKTKKFTHFMEVPSAYGLTSDNHGGMWFTVLKSDGPIGRVDEKTGKVSLWNPPTKARPQRIQVDTDGMVWFSERSGGNIGRFDPKTETFKEFPLPGPSPTPYALGIDKDHYIWYASTEQDTLNRLDPTTGEVIEYPFPHSEVMMRELFLDSQGRMWFATPTNNRVGYFYFGQPTEHASK